MSAWLSRAPSGTCRSSSSTSIQLLPTRPSRGSGGEAMGSVTRNGPPAADAHDPLRSWMCGIVSSASHCPATHTPRATRKARPPRQGGTQHWLPSPFSPRLCRRPTGRRMGRRTWLPCVAGPVAEGGGGGPAHPTLRQRLQPHLHPNQQSHHTSLSVPASHRQKGDKA